MLLYNFSNKTLQKYNMSVTGTAYISYLAIIKVIMISSENIMLSNESPVKYKKYAYPVSSIIFYSVLEME